MAALGVIEMVDENMANAARVHAIESGKTYDGRTLIAFGGGGPVHACRVAEKLGIDRVLVPSGAGVGSAIGFLRAPVGYEVVRSLYQRFSTFDVDAVNALLAEMSAEAEGVVRGRQLRRGHDRKPHRLYALCRPGPRNPGAAAGARADARRRRGDSCARTTREYTRFYDRPVPGSDVEIMSYAVQVMTEPQSFAADEAKGPSGTSGAPRTQSVRDTQTGEVTDWTVHDRAGLGHGARVPGPAIIAEDETSTLVGPGWSAEVDRFGYIELPREARS